MLGADMVCRVIGAPDPTSSGTDACPMPRGMRIRTGCLLLCLIRGKGRQEADQREGGESGRAVLCWRTQNSRFRQVDQPQFAVCANFGGVNAPATGDFPFPTPQPYTRSWEETCRSISRHIDVGNLTTVARSKMERSL